MLRILNNFNSNSNLRNDIVKLFLCDYINNYNYRLVGSYTEFESVSTNGKIKIRFKEREAGNNQPWAYIMLVEIAGDYRESEIYEVAEITRTGTPLVDEVVHIQILLDERDGYKGFVKFNLPGSILINNSTVNEIVETIFINLVAKIPSAYGNAFGLW